MICKCGSEYEKNNSYLCLPCRHQYDKQWRIKRKKLGLPCRGKRPSLQWFRAYWTKYYRRPEIRARRNALAKKYRDDPERRYKHLARWAINHALASGKLIKGLCEKCGASKTEGHHEDYMKPLIVKWLCRPCHRKEHTKAETGR